MFSTTTFITLALSAAVVVAIDSGPALLSCAEVDCPTGGGNVTSANCQVADRNLSAIGLATFEVSLTTNNSVTFTWTQGLETYDDVNPDVDLDRIYEKNFYLGSPQGVDLRANATNSPGLGACALFFTTVTDQVAFDGEDRRVSTGTCTDALDAGCVDAILAQARDVTASLDRQSSADACERLLSAFREGVASQCAQFAGSDGWEGLEVRDLTGPDAVGPITGAENSTSNCHPTLPKTNQLTRVASFNNSGTIVFSKETMNELFGITPILTLFFPRGDNASEGASAAEPQAQLACLKLVDKTDATEATKNDGSSEQGGSVLLTASRTVMLLGLAVPLAVWTFS